MPTCYSSGLVGDIKIIIVICLLYLDAFAVTHKTINEPLFYGVRTIRVLEVHVFHVISTFTTGLIEYVQKAINILFNSIQRQ